MFIVGVRDVPEIDQPLDFGANLSYCVLFGICSI